MAILIDTCNLYNATRRVHNKHVDYIRFCGFLRSLYGDDEKITAYVARTQKVNSFIVFLQHELGIYVKMKELRTKTDNFDVELALDALDTSDKKIIICSNSYNLLPLVNRLHNDRLFVYMHACGIPREFHTCAVTKEITWEVLEGANNQGYHEPNPTVEPMGLPTDSSGDAPGDTTQGDI